MKSMTMLIMAFVMLLAVGAHIFLGGPKFADGMQKELETVELQAIAFVLWHAGTATILCFFASHLWLVFKLNRALLLFISGLQLAWSGLFLVAGLSWMNNVMAFPHWVVFLLVPAVSLISARSWSSGEDSSLASRS